MNFSNTPVKKSFSKEIEKRLSLLILNTEEPFVIVDTELIIISYNQQFEKQYYTFFGIKIIRGISILNYAQKEKVEALNLIYQQALKGHSSQSEIEVSFEGTKNTFLLKYKPAYDENGETMGVFVSSTDITEVKRAQENLLASENRFRSLINKANDIVTLTDKTGRIKYISSAIERVTGFTPSEMIGQSLFSIIHPDQKKHSYEILENVLQNPGLTIPRVNQFEHKKGHFVWVEGTVTNLLEDPNVQAIVLNYHNISHRIGIEDELKQNEERLKAIIDSDPECVKIVDLTGKLLEMNPAGLKMLEADHLSQVQGKEIFDLIHPEDKKNYATLHQKACQGEKGIINFRAFTLNNNILWMESHFVPLKRNTNEIYAVLSVTRDVTEKLKSQKLLEANEKRFRALVENAGDAMAILNSEGGIKYASPSIKKVLGYNEEEVLKLNLFSVIHPDDLEKIQEVVIRSLNNPGVTIKGYTGRVLHKDGTWRWCESLVTNMLHDEHISGIVNNFRDVTTRIEAEEKLKNAENRFRTLIEHNYDGIVLRDKNLSIIYSSTSSERILGWTNEEKVGKDFLDKTHPDHAEKVKKNLEDVLNNPGVPFPLIYKTQHKDGQYIWVERVMTNMLHDDAISAIVANFRDITQKVNADSQKEFDHNNLSALINNTNDLMWSISRDGLLISSNEAFDKMIKNISGNEVVKGETFLIQGFGAEVITRWEGYYKRAYQGECFTVVEHTTEPVEQWAEISFYPFYNGNTIIGTACYSRNISSRKRFERKLEENTLQLLKVKTELESSEASLKKAQEIAHIGNWEFNFETKKSMWSDEAYRIYGLEPANHNFTQGEWLNFIHPEDRPEFEKEIKTCKETLSDSSYTHRILIEDGSVRHVLTEIRIELNSKKDLSGLYGTVLDVTDRVIAKKALVQSHEHLQKLTTNVPIAVYKFKIDSYGKMSFPFMSTTIHEMLPTVDIEELKSDGSSIFSRIHPEDIGYVLNSIEASRVNLSFWDVEFRAFGLDDKLFWIHASSRPQNEKDGAVVWYGFIQDITEKKVIDEKIRLSKERYDLVAKATNEAIWDWDLTTGDLHWGDGFKNLFGYEISTENSANNSWSAHIHPEDKERVMDSILAVVNSEDKLKWEQEYRYITFDGLCANVFDRGYIIRNNRGDAVRMIGAMQDVTQRKVAEEQILIAKERYDMVAKATNDSLYDWDLRTGATHRSGDGLNALFGYTDKALINLPNFWKSRIHPEDQSICESTLQEIFSDPTKLTCKMEYRFRRANGDYAFVHDKGYIIRDEKGTAVRMLGATQDVTRIKESEILLKELNENLETRAKELAISNTELEQFAYIASHDLQEPLRMVTSFLTLLESNYSEKLDTKAKQYIHFATDGAARMRQLILDLLEYSRVGKNTDTKVQIDTNELFLNAIKLNGVMVEEKKAVINSKKLPIVYADKTTLQQVFQNLIGNALKYQKINTVPVVSINTTENETHWQFSISDNGIGIEERYFEKIFIAFQRLHNKDEFSGTGIGLAICKKIIENHGGQIWVVSENNKGSIFHFTIAKNLK